jgi:hypothetical protein
MKKVSSAPIAEIKAEAMLNMVGESLRGQV